MRYFFHIAYNGHTYNGWQRHPKANSVQEIIETQLSKIFKTPIAINGCGRTDSGVHASQYFFHVDLAHEWDFDLIFRLNKSLPHSIAIYDVIPMSGKQHARFDAVQRKYDYYLHTYKDPYFKQISSYYDTQNLNLAAMQAAVALLPQYKDFRAFCTAPDKNEHTICNVMEAQLYTTNGDQIRFHIASNRFLSKMIRIIMGRLIKIGKAEMSVDEFENLLITKEPSNSVDIAQPNGLYLSKVTYPYLNLPLRNSTSGLLNNNWIAL